MAHPVANAADLKPNAVESPASRSPILNTPLVQSQPSAAQISWPELHSSGDCSRRPVLLAAISVLGLVAASPAFADATALKVTATIKPIHALVAGVMQGVGEPALLVSGTASPHTYAMKPSDAKTLNESNVFFRVSANVEPFTGKIVEALPPSVKVVTLADTQGLELLPVRTGNTFERHDHAHEHAAHDDDDGDGDDHDHDHDGHEAGKHADHDGEHGSHDHHDDPAESHDGHVWLDPDNAIRMVAEIARVLSAADPADAQKYADNAARVTAEIEATKAEIDSTLAPVRSKPFVVFHDAYQYFERRFGLTAAGSITASPEVQPSAKRLSEIRTKITNLEAACVFAEPMFKPNLIAAVTEGTKARGGTLDPEGALLTPGPNSYTQLLKNLATGLKTCLSEGS